MTSTQHPASSHPDITWQRDDTGIVILTMDAPDASANTFTESFGRSLAAVVERIRAAGDSLTGVVLTSAKKTFFAGGDLHEMLAVGPDDAAELQERITATKATLRALETLSVPVVAAIGGAALGGGLEIALACHHRIAVDDPRVRIGLPEVTLGLLPGGGGIVRTVRLLGLQQALDDVLMSGRTYQAMDALGIGLIDEVVGAPEELVPAATAWIAAHPAVQAPWDRTGYILPGDTPAPQIAALQTAALRKRTRGAPDPAAHAILNAAVEGAGLDLDTAFDVETRYFVSVATGPIAKNMIKGGFLDLRRVRSGDARPAGVETFAPKRLGVIGAGMMGAGIAYVAAHNSIDVVLVDVSLEAAERGRDYSTQLVERLVSKGDLDRTAGDALLAHIATADEVAAVADCDAVIEAVFEDPDLKKATFAKVGAAAPAALLASNTSTLPITELAEGSLAPTAFVGMHFFSPVERMALLEIVVGKHTSEQAVAHAFDLGLALGRTPIVVSDGRGFFTSRVVTTRVKEAMAMVGEGVPAATVERAALQAGYPVGPLHLIDQTSIALSKKVADETRQAQLKAGARWTEHPADAVMARMVDDWGRPGRAGGGGFYDYSGGRRTGLWPGLAEQFSDAVDIPFDDVRDRLLFSEALEAARAFEEGVVRSAADANVGSLLGIGFPRWTGGIVQFMDNYAGGLRGFVERAEELAARYGDHLRPPANLIELAGAGRTFSAVSP